MIINLVCIAKNFNVPSGFATIQEAIDNSSPKDTILVDPGTYKENIIIDNKNITLISNFVKTGKAEYIIATIIDGREKGSVITITGDNSLTVIDGFTIRNGKAESGGGILLDKAHPVLKNLSLINNSAKLKGGAISAFFSEACLENLIIKNNSTTGVGSSGGGVSFMNSKASIINSNITNNKASFGGGIYCNNSQLTLIDLNVNSNEAQTKGGGLYFLNCDDQNLLRMKIKKNKVLHEKGTGGGLCFESSNFIMAFCDISYNSSANAAGLFFSYCTPQILNSLIYKNMAIYNGGAMKCDHSYPKLINVTITANSAEAGGAIFNTRSSIPDIRNSIIWNNRPEDFIKDYTSKFKIEYSNITAEINGLGNLKINPKFIEITKDNYRLSNISPCRNKGNSDVKYNDFDGSRNDLGAYGGQKGRW